MALAALSEIPARVETVIIEPSVTFKSCPATCFELRRHALHRWNSGIHDPRRVETKKPPPTAKVKRNDQIAYPVVLCCRLEKARLRLPLAQQLWIVIAHVSHALAHRPGAHLL